MAMGGVLDEATAVKHSSDLCSPLVICSFASNSPAAYSAPQRHSAPTAQPRTGKVRAVVCDGNRGLLWLSKETYRARGVRWFLAELAMSRCPSLVSWRAGEQQRAAVGGGGIYSRRPAGFSATPAGGGSTNTKPPALGVAGLTPDSSKRPPGEWPESHCSGVLNE